MKALRLLPFVLAIAFAFVVGVSTQHTTDEDVRNARVVRDTIVAPIAALEGCNNQPLVQDVTNAFTAISGCVVSSIVTGGLSNPLQIAAQCGGIVVAQVISIVENEIAREKSDAGAVGSSERVAKLQVVLAAAKALPPQ